MSVCTTAERGTGRLGGSDSVGAESLEWMALVPFFRRERFSALGSSVNASVGFENSVAGGIGGVTAVVGVKDTSNGFSTDVSVGIGVEKITGVGRIASMAWVTTGIEGLGSFAEIGSGVIKGFDKRSGGELETEGETDALAIVGETGGMGESMISGLLTV